MIDEYFEIIVLIIMLGAGILGGITNYFSIIKPSDHPDQRTITFWRSIFISLCAALVVPLFLQILSNRVLSEHRFENLIIFLGFCVLASFFSKRFLSDIYTKVQQVQNDVERVKEGTAENADKISSIDSKVDQLEAATVEIDVPSPNDSIKEGFDEEKSNKLWRTFRESKFSLRSVKGLTKESGLDIDFVQRTLHSWLDFGLVDQVFRNGTYYYKIRPNPIKVYSANYGVGTNIVDVTPKMQYFVDAGILVGSVSPANLGVDDLAPGQMKTLTIHCRVRGVERELKFSDGHQFDLQILLN